MANELIINASLPETRIALMENGEIQELLIERASGKGIVGNIYKGRVTRVLPGMQAAFVDIGLEKAAFLYVDDVFVHSEIWEDEEGPAPVGEGQDPEGLEAEEAGESTGESEPKVLKPTGVVIRPRIQTETVEGTQGEKVETSAASDAESSAGEAQETQGPTDESQVGFGDRERPQPLGTQEDSSGENQDESSQDESSGQAGDDDLDQDDDEGPSGRKSKTPQDPVSMGPDPEASEGESDKGAESDAPSDQDDREGDSSGDSSDDAQQGTIAAPSGEGEPTKRPRRNRRGGRFRKKKPGGSESHGPKVSAQPVENNENYPEKYKDHMADQGNLESDRTGLAEQASAESPQSSESGEPNRPQDQLNENSASERRVVAPTVQVKAEFKAARSRDRRIRPKVATRSVRMQVNIQDLLKEGQEVLVQVAKDPIATKGARLTCHISLPGRHLVCMPTIDHVGVSRRIDREDERRRLREFVEKNRPRNLGFIVRTASGKQQSEKRIKQDVEYLTRIWNEIKEKAAEVTAPALVYEDLNSVLRAIRDWVTEEIDKVIVDSRYHFNEIQKFVSHFMPPLRQKVELYHGDIPIFDAYGISTELSRALERKVWLKSGGYIVVDQAEALVAIDVNTGRYVGKKNLEDTILKTNLEAVQEIAYQLRLRNCGGIIILDLIDMEKDENKHRVYRALEDALSKDRARPTILKISELGLVEMTRKRTRDTIVRTLCESCSHCEGKGFIKAKTTVAYEAMREVEREGIERDVNKVLIQAHPDVIDILAIDERETLDQMEKKYRKQVYLQAVPDFHPEQFEVTAEKPGEKGKERPSERTHEKSHDRHERGDRKDRGHRHGRSEGRGGDREQAPSGPVKLPVPLAVPLPRNVEKKPEAAPAPVVSEDSIGNTASPGNPSVPDGPVLGAPKVSPASSQDGGFEEEDRLAFLRAQAAQDAALARLASSGSHAARGNQNSGGGHDREGRRGGRGRRSGGGGRFQQGRNDRGRGKPFGFQGGGPKWQQGEPKESAPIAPIPSNESSGGSGGDSGGKSGAGDQSQPF